MQPTLTFLKKILLIRFSSIGDIVLTTPVIRSLKTQLNCELHVLSKKQYAGIYSENPYIDKTHFLSKRLDEVVSNLKTERFDHIVDLQKNVRSKKLCNALKLPYSSFPKVNAKKWIFVNFKIDRLPDVHIVDRYFESVKSLNVVNDNKGLDYFIPKKDKIKISSLHPVLNDGYIGFVIGARHNTKIFPQEKVISLTEKLHLPVVLLGGPEDKERGDEIASHIHSNKVINSCGRFNLNQSASIVKQASLIITNDTGLMHIAAAFQKPIISIWGNTVPRFGMFPYLTDNKEYSFIAEVNGLRCRPCSKLGFKQCPKKHFKCMLDQDEDQIAEIARRFAKPSPFHSKS